MNALDRSGSVRTVRETEAQMCLPAVGGRLICEQGGCVVVHVTWFSKNHAALKRLLEPPKTACMHRKRAFFRSRASVAQEQEKR